MRIGKASKTMQSDPIAWHLASFFFVLFRNSVQKLGIENTHENVIYISAPDIRQAFRQFVIMWIIIE